MQPLTIGLVIGSQDLWDEAQTALRSLPVRILLEQPGIDDWPAFLQKLERLRPDALLIDLTGLREPAAAVLARLKASPAKPALVAIHTETEPETILGAIRAGANEYLYPPLEKGLVRALERISNERFGETASARKLGKALAFFSAKGGCGATTLACHIALELGRQSDKDVLLADFDIDAGIVAFLMKASSPYSVLDAVNNIHRLDHSYWKALVSNGLPRLEVLQAPPPLAAREQLNPEYFRHVLRFIRSHYPWTVVDLGRSLNLLSMSLLEDFDEAFLVTMLELPALHQTKKIIQQLTDSGYSRSRLRLVLNRWPKRPDLRPDELEQMLGVPVYATIPNDYAGLQDSYADGKLVGQDSELGRELTRLALKIAGLAEKPKKRFALFS